MSIYTKGRLLRGKLYDEALTLREPETYYLVNNVRPSSAHILEQSLVSPSAKQCNVYEVYIGFHVNHASRFHEIAMLKLDHEVSFWKTAFRYSVIKVSILLTPFIDKATLSAAHPMTSIDYENFGRV